MGISSGPRRDGAADPWTTYGLDPGTPDLVMPSTASVPRLADLARANGMQWAGRRAPQSQPALDLAAATVVWGLMDQPYDQPDTLANLSCDQSAAAFRALTQTGTAGAACTPAGG